MMAPYLGNPKRTAFGSVGVRFVARFWLYRVWLMRLTSVSEARGDD